MTNNLETRKRDNELAKSIIAAPLYDNLNIQRRSELRKSSIYGKEEERVYDNLPTLINQAITFSAEYAAKKSQLGFGANSSLSNRYWENVKENSSALFTCFNLILAAFNDGNMQFAEFGQKMHIYNKLLASGILLDHNALHSDAINKYSEDYKLPLKP